MLVLLAFGATLLKHVPDAALGGVLLFVALRLIRFRLIATICRESFPEFFLVVATAAAIIALPIEEGVAIGIILSLLHGIWSTMRARLERFERVPGTTIWWPASPHNMGERVANVTVVGMHAPLSFLNADGLKAEALEILRTEAPKLLVLEASGMPEIDFTAAQALRELIEECDKQGVTVAVARLESPRAEAAFERFGLYELLPRQRRFHSVAEAVAALAK